MGELNVRAEVQIVRLIALFRQVALHATNNPQLVNMSFFK
jgi:hypothetical protein